MDFVALLSVFVMITNTRVSARPAADSENDATKDGLISEEISEKSEETVFKFPTAMKHGFTMTINGTIDSTQSETFTAILKAEDGGICRITYDFKKKEIEISSDVGTIQQEEYDPADDGPMNFSLFVRARKNEEDNQMFQLTFEANNAGESRIVNCKVKDIDDFGYIVFKEGVQKITSLLFEFNNM